MSTALVALVITLGVDASAQQSNGAPPLARARAAFDANDFQGCTTGYAQAIDTGGLAPDDLLESYVRLGTCLSRTKRDKFALEAFRKAALIDPSFSTPTQAGKKGTKLAEQARREKARYGPIALHAEFPNDPRPGYTFGVDATLDAPHITLVAEIRITARDSLSGRSYTHDEPAAPQVHFDVSKDVTLPGATLVIRVDAIDAHENRLTSVEQRVRVAAAKTNDVAAGGTTGVGTVSTADDGSAASNAKSTKDPTSKDKGTDKASGGGFWSTAWPYVIGGGLLAAGGAAVYLFTRPGDTVNVGAAHVQALH